MRCCVNEPVFRGRSPEKADRGSSLASECRSSVGQSKQEHMRQFAGMIMNKKYTLKLLVIG